MFESHRFIHSITSKLKWGNSIIVIGLVCAESILELSHKISRIIIDILQLRSEQGRRCLDQRTRLWCPMRLRKRGPGDRQPLMRSNRAMCEPSMIRRRYTPEVIEVYVP